MKRLAIASAAVLAVASQAHAQQQPTDCPNTGDSCIVPSGADFLDFPQPYGGIFGNNITIGTLIFPWGTNIVACVDGEVEWSDDPQGLVRSTLTHKSVICTGSGSDTVKVLSGSETQWCTFLGIPLLMAPINYNGFELAVFGQGGNDVITGGAGSDQLCGGSGNDRLYGRGLINELNGGSGHDDLYGGTDLDYLYGAEGDDIIVDSGTGGFRGTCSGGQPLPPSRIEGGGGNDCLQLPPIEPGWCYAQMEPCGGSVLCHGGIYCGSGTDRIDTPSQPGLSCETRTSNTPCRR